jgi:hypothetical protein
MNKNRHILFGGTPELPLKADGHLTDAWLLLAIDGELSASDYVVVKDHVRACWTCRARKEHLERTIEDIVEYEQALVAPDMPPSSGGKAIFMARLDQLAAELGSPSLVRRWGLMLLQTYRLVFSSRVTWVTWVACSSLTVIVCFYVVLHRNTPVVSASELLQRAAASESGLFAGVSQPVMVQKLSIKVNGYKIARTIYRDRAGNRRASRADVSAQEESVTERAFQQSSLSWDDPLSPQAYSHWRDGIAEKRDVMTRVDGDLLRLDTTASSGPVAEASLTVRASDYHPVEENVRLRDESRVEIAELSYDVVAFASLSPDIFGNPISAPALKLPVITTSNKVADDAELAMTELQVRSALHNLGADLGEQIDVQPKKDGSVRVEGIAADDARRLQLVSALRAIPRTQVHIETVAQATTHQQAIQVSGPVRVAVMAGATPLLETSLKQRFPDDDQRTAYVNQTLALTQGASARVWALNRLAERYSPQQVALLDSVSRQRLGMLLGDHLSALREEINRLQNQLGQVLSPSSNTAAANTASSKFTSSEMPEHADDWRSHVHRMHSSVETVDESVAVLLTGSSTDEKDDPEAIEIGLRTTLTQLQAELQVLDQQIHKQF